MLVISFFFVVASLGVAPLSVTEEQVAAKVKALDPNRSKNERLTAAKWFVKHASSQETLKALTHLEQVVRNDKSPDVRYQAMRASGRIAAAHKKPCPKAVIDTLLDEERFADGQSLGSIASRIIQQFKSVPLRARPMLIKRFLALAKREASADVASRPTEGCTKGVTQHATRP